MLLQLAVGAIKSPIKFLASQAIVLAPRTPQDATDNGDLYKIGVALFFEICPGKPVPLPA